jgi:CubicO group peptidase (beta-lactamase class C family)
VHESDAVSSFMEEQMLLHRIPGAAIAATIGDETIFSRAYGVADIELQEPVTPDSTFEICSITKQFTATATLRLIERGALRLDDHLAYFIPRPPNAWHQITLRHLLTASSGIPDYINDLEGHDVPIRGTAHELVDYVSRIPLRFTPGEQWSYSNTGYVLLTLVIEAVTGVPYDDHLASQVLGPLGLQHTFANDLSREVTGRVKGYELQGGTWIDRRVHWSGKESRGDGDLLSTLTDVLIWARSWRDQSLLSSHAIQSAFTSATSNRGHALETNLPSRYGLAWFLAEHLGHPVQWTPGAGEGFSTSLMRLPADDIVVVVLLNLRHFLLADDIARGLAQLLW